MSHLSCDNSTKPQLFQTYQTETSSSSFQTTCNPFYTTSFENIFYPIRTAVKKIIGTRAWMNSTHEKCINTVLFNLNTTKSKHN